mmetsp:Transcript_9629/g.24920  ORF Transcript_9629/g.24920 Transcript_9629/m.24920 type:complete len:232 (+) Transcript_9629:694-1389(+)
MVSSASRPNESLASSTSAYASSMMSTPPRADSTTARVLMAVCPAYPATKEPRSASTTWPRRSMRSDLSRLATMRAIVVLPVPGFPTNSMCSDCSPPLGSPASFRSRFTCNCAARERMNDFASARPITSSSRASTSPIDCSLAESSKKSGSVSVTSRSRETVPIAKTRSVCRLIACSTRLRTSRPLPLAASVPLTSCCTSAASFASLRNGSSSVKPRSATITRTICAISSVV